jgi:hypothetical protein
MNAGMQDAMRAAQLQVASEPNSGKVEKASTIVSGETKVAQRNESAATSSSNSGRWWKPLAYGAGAAAGAAGAAAAGYGVYRGGQWVHQKAAWAQENPKKAAAVAYVGVRGPSGVMQDANTVSNVAVTASNVLNTTTTIAGPVAGAGMTYIGPAIGTAASYAAPVAIGAAPHVAFAGLAYGLTQQVVAAETARLEAMDRPFIEDLD